MFDKATVHKEMLDLAKTFNDNFDKSDAAKQKYLLDHAKAMVDIIDASPTLTKELKKERDAFDADVVKNGIQRYEKAHGTYSYTLPKDVEGDIDGQKFEEDAAKAGDKVNKFFHTIGDKVRNFFSGDKKDGADKKEGADKDAGKKEKKFKKDKNGNVVLDKNGQPVEAGFFDDLDIGNMLGGLAGAIGGWLVGNMFGGGMIGMLMGGMLAIGGMFLGKKALGNTINGWLGRPSDPGNPQKSVSQPQVQQQVAAGQGNGQSVQKNQSVEAALTPEQQQEARNAFQSAYLEITGHAYGSQPVTYSPSYQPPQQPSRGADMHYRR